MRISVLTICFCLTILNTSATELGRSPHGFVFSFQAIFKENKSSLTFRLSGKDTHTIHLSPDELVIRSSRGLFQNHKERWKLNIGIKYPILIQSRKRSLSVYAEGRRVMSLPRDEGETILSVEQVDKVAVESPRFQPVDTVHFGDDFMRKDDKDSGWKVLHGKWQMAKATQLDFAASPFRLHAVEGKNARYVTGYPFWRDYLFQASTRIHSEKASTGLCFYRMGDTEFIFRWNGPKSLFELIYRNGEETKSLATREGELEKQQWYRLGVAVCGTQVRCLVDETEVLRASCDLLAQGGIGLHASPDSGPVEFDDVSVEGMPYEERKFASLKHDHLIDWLRSVQPRKEVINSTFIKDRYMQNWTSASSAKPDKEESEEVAVAGRQHHTESKENYYGYTFFRAPSDWWRSTGRWDAYSRWSCRPEWSFFAGTDDHLALIWNKRSFPGDVSVDIYAANPMVTMRPPFYGETSLNLTICGDGENPFSGYTVSMGGWNRPVTRLYRQNKVVAMSTEAIIPASRPADYHREWFHLQLVKIGRRVIFSFEEKKIFEFDDPKPLKGSRIGIWSLESGISIARAQIKFHQEGEMWTKIERGHPVIRAQGWKMLDGDQGALPVAMEERGRKFVRLINKRAGGTFAAAPAGLPVNLGERPVISFSYRMTNAVSANFYFQIGGHWHQLQLSGTSDTRLPTTKLGAIQVKTDGKWHKADFDLLPAILKSHTRAPFIIKRIRIGLLEANDLLAAGRGANQKGAHWDIANLKFSASQGTTNLPAENSKNNPLLETFEDGIDNWENFGGTDGAMLYADSNGGGTCTSLQLYKKTHGGVFGARWIINQVNLEEHPMLELDYRMPENVRVGLLARIGKKWLSIVFSSGMKAKLPNQAAVKVERNNQWHPLQIPLLELFTKAFPNNDSLMLNEIIFSDQAEPGPNGYRGNIKGTRYWLDNVRFVRNEKTNPVATIKAGNRPEIQRPYVTVKYPDTLSFESFESDRMPWRDWCEGTVMHAAMGAMGAQCARIFGYRENAYFSTMIWENWIDLDRYPIMSFDYRIPSTAALGFAINLDDYFYLLPFTKKVNLEALSIKRRAEYVNDLVGDCSADNQWHSTEINLLDCLKARFPNRNLFRIRDLRTQRMGGNIPLGQSCYFDNVAFHSRKPGEVRIQWKTPPGIVAIKYSLDRRDDGVPDKLVPGSIGELKIKLEAGTHYFHLSTKNAKGNLSDVVHKKIVLE